ncbi:hypothetical protein CEXT_725381 [Caerostris extrusa]|uniref:Uncharacterized protein n=1 Tax=Caerostris extrusa TaxID=172846 RepID=A0AAV4XMY3_CAEEX|nr:hypothetical protein CEXT_725381 [Caerostris extrusa]
MAECLSWRVSLFRLVSKPVQVDDGRLFRNCEKVFGSYGFICSTVASFLKGEEILVSSPLVDIAKCG